jgi:4-hydroxybenzoyl-CoA thioesterase
LILANSGVNDAGLVQSLEFIVNRSTNALVGVAPVMIRRQVDFGECDPKGIVYTPRFSDYLLAAFNWFMIVMLHDVGRAAIAEATPMRGLELDFRRMLFPGDWFTMTCYVTAIRVRTYDLAIRASNDDGEIAFLGRLSPIATDRATGASAVLPALLAQRLRAYQESCPAPADVMPSHAV